MEGVFRRGFLIDSSKKDKAKVNGSDENAHESKEFSDWIRRIGVRGSEKDENGKSEIEIPQNLLIQDSGNPLLDLVNFAYPNLEQNMKDFKFFEKRIILTPTMESVEMVNDYVLSKFPGDRREYLSADTCTSTEEEFTMEFLNDIKFLGIPNHKLTLKEGVPVMLMRDLDLSRGLCNGTRLVVDKLGQFVIKATVMSGSNAGETTLIPRVDFAPSDPEFPVQFKRRQFPLCLCFAMTIKKSQGQTLSHVGIFLRNSVLTRSQLYAAVSGVKSQRGLKILILDDEGRVAGAGKNVVCKD